MAAPTGSRDSAVWPTGTVPPSPCPSSLPKNGRGVPFPRRGRPPRAPTGPSHPSSFSKRPPCSHEDPEPSRAPSSWNLPPPARSHLSLPTARGTASETRPGGLGVRRGLGTLLTASKEVGGSGRGGGWAARGAGCLCRRRASRAAGGCPGLGYSLLGEQLDDRAQPRPRPDAHTLCSPYGVTVGPPPRSSDHPAASPRPHGTPTGPGTGPMEMWGDCGARNSPTGQGGLGLT